MCLAIPGRILTAEENDGMRVGRVQFGGIVRSARLVGFAISRVDEREAERTYELLRQMGALDAELPPEENESV